MSQSHPSGLLAAYNSLTDKHLAGYFNNTRIRRHLLRSGLITRSGRIISEKEYKLNIMKKDHQKYIRECFAQAIFHKVLDMERYHQLEIKRKLETLARKERIQRFKGEPIKWPLEKNMPALPPHLPVVPKTKHGHSVLVDEGRSSLITLVAPRPYTAPGVLQPPIRLQPLPSNPAVGTVPKVTSGSRSKLSTLENEAPFPIGGKKAEMKFRNLMDNSQGMNRYQLLNINSYMMPSPPPPPPLNGKITEENRPETWRRRRFHPTTAPNGLEPVFTRDSRRMNKTPLHSNAVITMIYLGKNVHLSYDHPDFRDEIKVYQQHCGGENLCVFKGKLLEKETFQFISKRHHGFPFSLTFFLNGMQVNRLSSCCEYKHRKGSRLGGKRGYFGFVCVERSSPCYKCIIAMGLDKRPPSPKPRKQTSVEKREELKKGEGRLRKDRAYLKPRRNKMLGSKASASVIFAGEEAKTGIEDVRTAVGEMERKGKPHIWEDDQENMFRYEYEEDFEVDEEKQDRKANKGQAEDGMNALSMSPSNKEKGNEDLEKESVSSSQKAPNADDNVKDKGDGCTESELKEDKQDIKTSSSSSSRSHLYSSCSEDESVLGDKEAHAESSPNESVGNSSSQELSGNDVPGKSYFTIEGSLKIEVEGKKIIKADVETNPPMMEESLENVLEEEPKKGTRVIAESLSEKPRKHVSKEEQRNYRSKLWKGSTAKVKDKSAGPCRVEQSVEKILDEAVEPGWHGFCEAEFRISSTDEGKKHLKEPETDTSAALNSNLVEEESTALKSHKESKPLASEIYTLEKEEAVEEDKVPQHRDADTIERKGGIRLWGKAGFDEVPLGEWKPSAEYPALAELLTQEREIPQGKTSRAEADGDRELDKEGLNPMAKEAAKASGGPNEEEAPEKQALMQTISETVKAASEEDGGWGKAVSASQPAMLNLECSQEVVVLGEAVMLEKEEAECGTGSAKPDVEDREEETSIDMEEVEPEEDTASQRRDISEEAICQEEDPVQARGATIGTEISVSIPSSEKAETAQMRVSEESLEKLCKEDEKRKEVDIKVESNKGDDRKETLPEELDAAGGRMKAERPKTPLGENKTQREEVTRANALQVEGILEEEQTFKGEEGEIVKGVKPERGSQVPPNGLEGDVENEASMVASELTGDLGLQEDSLRVGEMTMFEAAPGFEKSPENIIAVKKEGGGERQREAGAPEHKCRAELRCAEDVSPSEHNGGPGPEGQDVSGAPEGDPAGQMPAAELTVTAAGEAQDHAVRDQDDLAGLESGGKKGSLHGQQVVGATGLTQEDSSEGDSSVAEKSSGETIDKDPEEEVDEENALGTSVMTSEQAEGDGNLQEGGVVSEEDFQEKEAAEMAEEKREVSADLKIAERKTEADTGASFSREAGEETWHEVDELLGKTAAADKVAVEEIALSSGEEPAVEEVVIIRASEAEVEDVGLEKMAPQPGPDQKGEETDSSQRAEFLGDKAGRGRHGAVQESSEAEDFGLGLSQETESEPRRESLQDVKIFSIKANCPGTQGKQEHTMQRESENTDVCPNKKP